MLYEQRKRFRERAEAEARGENFWTDSFAENVRIRLMYAASEAATGDEVLMLQQARHLILKARGAHYLSGYGPAYSDADDFRDYFLTCPDEAVATAVEALYVALESFVRVGIPLKDPDNFGREVQEILDQERVAYEFARGQMIPFKSKELHQQVVEPAMKLLHDPRFAEAEKAYQHALEEVAKGKPGDAITDAGTSLQEALKALGCDGNSLGPLIKSAKANGLLVAHDARFTEAMESVLVWVAAQRNVMGDSHWADKAAKDDAWFIIHVVGALIVRLVAGNTR